MIRWIKWANQSAFFARERQVRKPPLIMPFSLIGKESGTKVLSIKMSALQKSKKKKKENWRR